MAIRVQGQTISGALIVVMLSTVLLLWLGLSGIQRGDELATADEFGPKQTLWLVLSAVGASIAMLIPYRQWKHFAYPVFVASILLLFAVYLFPPRNGARRWIFLGAFSFQPSEVAKLGYLFAISHYLMFRENHRTLIGLIVPYVMTIVPVGLILIEPDLGTSMLFFPVLFAVLYAAGARPRHLLLTVIAGLMATPVLWLVMSAEQKSRVTAVFLQENQGRPETGDGYHLYQSKQMLALGGPWGSERTGMPIDDPAAYRLPAGRTDFIFCLVGEKWGIPGTLGALGLFAALICGGLSIAAATRDPFGRLLSTGIVMMIAAQVVINTSMTVGLAPITGLTLPLMSYGGTSLIMTSASIGILANIAFDPGYDVGGQPFQFEKR